MTVTTEILIDCKACQGTGIYRGFAELEGVGVVCSNCDGTGAQPLRYTPFAGRKLRKDVDVVFVANTDYVLGKDLRIPEVGEPVTYAEFLDGKLPTPPKEKQS